VRPEVSKQSGSFVCVGRIGLFGGSFDPVHYGHLLLAECCRGECRLDEVHFLPAAVPPHKWRDVTAAGLRVEMLELAIAGHPAFSVSRYEVKRGGVSYTVDTLRHYHAEYPGSELFLLLGADMLLDLPSWREASEVCRLAIPVVAARPGFDDPDYSCIAKMASSEQIAVFSQYHVTMPQIGVSSTEIRRRVAAGQSIRYWTPRAVEKYIEEHGLYREDG
jgi:nicotinate-nucleotide adenylyltransferase